MAAANPPLARKPEQAREPWQSGLRADSARCHIVRKGSVLAAGAHIAYGDANLSIVNLDSAQRYAVRAQESSFTFLQRYCYR